MESVPKGGDSFDPAPSPSVRLGYGKRSSALRDAYRSLPLLEGIWLSRERWHRVRIGSDTGGYQSSMAEAFSL